MHPRPAHRVGQPALTHDDERLTGGQRADEPVDRLARLERADEHESTGPAGYGDAAASTAAAFAAGPGSPGPAARRTPEPGPARSAPGHAARRVLGGGQHAYRPPGQRPRR